MIKTLIITGGNLDKKLINKIYSSNKFNYIIVSDKGIEYADKNNIKPNYIIGDFDSAKKEVIEKYKTDKEIVIRKLNPEKDYTDTHMALKLAISIKSKYITIIGATGTRMDHNISNINVLKEALDNNVKCKIIDNNNEIELINKKTIVKKDSKYKYISLIPLTSKVEGVTLKGFKYSLLNRTLNIGESIGVSNEQTSNNAQIEIKNGILILIKSKD